MRILLDTANLDDIRYFNTYYPIEGVTTNPTILAKEGGDPVAQLKAIREIIGNDKELHIQVTETDFDKIIEEAKLIVDYFGINTFVKIPVTDVGLRVTKYLSDRGIGVTVTAVLNITLRVYVCAPGLVVCACSSSKSSSCNCSSCNSRKNLCDLHKKNPP